MSKPTQSSRRKFIAGTGSLLALASISNSLNAEQLVNTTSLLSESNQQSVLVVYRESDTHSVEFAAVFAEAGISVVALSIDPVRQWRDSLSAMLNNKQQVIIGLSNWPDYIIMSGLASEQRRYSMLVAQHKVKQENHHDWASTHALELLQVADDQSLQDLQLSYKKAGYLKQLKGNSLFSWKIT